MNLGERIKKIREENGISQEEFVKKINQIDNKIKLSRVTLSQIENNKRDISANEIMAISKVLNIPVEYIYNPQKEPQIILREENEKYSLKEKNPIRIDVPQKNIEKFKEVLLYILNKIGAKPNIGESVLYKLLYFIDFDYYEKYEEQLIGATYIKNHYGPTPVEFKKIVNDMISKKEIIKVESKYFDYLQTKYLPLKKPKLAILKANEIELIDDVLSRLSNKSAKEISDYSHQDVPWLSTRDGGDIIKYESVFYRTAPYSVREYKDDI